jgi:hypothetical protein
MEIQTDEKISLFVRDAQTGRFQFNARALQALGIVPTLAQQCGYPLTEQSDKAADALSSNAA